MKNKVVMKIPCLLILIMIATAGAAGADFPFTDTRDAAAPAQLVAVVDGTSVNFDWSAMVAANSYTMAVALSDGVGNIDMSSLNLLDMGTQKTFSSSGLPSGMIFYAVILAYTDQGLVVSDTVKFMPFSGTVTYFNAGDVILQIADPGGIGNFTVSGYFDGDIANLTQISGDDGFGPFTLTVENDKPAVYTKGGYILNFTYDAAGTIGILRTAKRTASLEMNDCQKMIKDKTDKLTDDYWEDIGQLRAIYRNLIYMIIPSVLNSRSDDSEFDLDVNKKTSAKDKVWSMIDLIQAAAEGRNMTYKEERGELDKQYEDCQDDPAPTPEPDPEDPYDPLVVDNSCSIPAGAVKHEDIYKTGAATYYTLNGVMVGSYRYWKPLADGEQYLDRESCNNVAGQLQGWAIAYFKNGNMKRATHYKNGIQDGQEYIFFCGDQVWADYTWEDGVKTHSRTYNLAGELCSYWDIDGDGWSHVVCKDSDSPPMECE